MDENLALICAFDVTSRGNASPLAWNELSVDQPKGSWRWIHLDRTDPDTESWLRSERDLPTLAIEALLAEETRPRIFSIGSGHIIILRGVNLNPGADPEDMVSIRLWVENGRIISLRRRRLLAVQDLRNAFESGKGPRTIGEFLAVLAFTLIERMSPVVTDLEDVLDELEESGVTLPTAEQRDRLVSLRRQAIPLRRFLSPQRDALLHASTLKVDWLDAEHAARMREAYDQASRLIESLDAIRERAGLLHEEFANRVAERTNRNMYVLTVAAAIFLPLGFLTGLLGINVAGIPGTENPSAFSIVTGLIIIIGAAEFALLKFLRWI